MDAAAFTCPDLVPAAWSALRPARDFHHGGDRCPTAADRALYGRVAPACEPCRDLLVDALVHLAAVVDDGTRTPAFAYRVTRNRMTDALRAENARRAGAARPERTDGPTGRIRAAVARLPEPVWNDVLLTRLLAAATARGPVPLDGWPYESFAREKSGIVGRTVRAGEVRRDVDALVRLAGAVAGPSWVDAHLVAPLRFRRGEYSTLRVGPAHDDPRVTVVDPAAEDDCDGDRDAVEDRFWTELRLGGRPEAALRRAAGALGCDDVPPALLRAVARQYVAQAVFRGSDARPGTTEQVRARIGPDLPSAFVRSVLALITALPHRPVRSS